MSTKGEYGIFTEMIQSSQRLYRVSTEKRQTKLTPRVPSNYFTKNGYEDSTTPRVCFSTSIKCCLRALSMKCEGMELYVYTPDKYYKVYKPNTKEVPDCKITKEVWIKEPVKLKCIGKIKVGADTGEDGFPFTYGSGKDKHTAELYDWSYEWIEKYEK